MVVLLLDASNDLESMDKNPFWCDWYYGYILNEMPHMIHFDNVELLWL